MHEKRGEELKGPARNIFLLFLVAVEQVFAEQTKVLSENKRNKI